MHAKNGKPSSGVPEEKNSANTELRNRMFDVPSSLLLTGRLPSLNGPRDLTLRLGSPALGHPKHSNVLKQKKTYVPNLSVRRERKLDESANSSQLIQADTTKQKKKNEPKKEKREFIQTQGSIFSEGISESSLSKRTGKMSIKKEILETKQAIPKPSLSNKEEEEKLKELFHSDYLDSEENFGDDRLHPVQLPFKWAVRKELKDEESCDFVKKEFKECPIMPRSLPQKTLVQHLETLGEEDFLFLQLPDCLPGTFISDGKLEDESLPPFPAGHIGVIQVHESGNTELKLNNNHVLSICSGTQVEFLQEVAQLHLNSEAKDGHLVILGEVKHRLVCQPSWNDLIDDS